MLPLTLSVALLCISSAASFPPAARHDHDHEDVIPRQYSGSWHQPRNHFARALFSRGPEDFADVGTPEWSAGFPAGGSSPGVAQIPAEWKAALDAAVTGGRIPNVPQTTVGNGGPSYPSGTDAGAANVCSSTVQCRLPGDIWDAPEGVYASSFDDGPLPASVKLTEFLTLQNQTTTHFMIGTNMLSNAATLNRLIDADADLAVHTWSHRYMTSLSNEEVVGELGWTMQLIFNSTDGKLPRFWRPPYGNSDARVSAIAREVLGLTTVIWNHDTADWTMSSPGGPGQAAILASFDDFLELPKSPGLVVLHHDQNDATVDVFINGYPHIESNGWKYASLAEAFGGSDYQDDEDFIELFGEVQTTSTSASSTSSSTSSTATAASQTGSPDAAAAQQSSNSANSLVTVSSSMSLAAACFSALFALQMLN